MRSRRASARAQRTGSWPFLLGAAPAAQTPRPVTVTATSTATWRQVTTSQAIPRTYTPPQRTTVGSHYARRSYSHSSFGPNSRWTSSVAARQSSRRNDSPACATGSHPGQFCHCRVWSSSRGLPSLEYPLAGTAASRYDPPSGVLARPGDPLYYRCAPHHLYQHPS